MTERPGGAPFVNSLPQSVIDEYEAQPKTAARGEVKGVEQVPMSEMHHYESADFEVPMHETLDNLEFREDMAGPGASYKGLDHKPTSMRGYVDQLKAHIKEHGIQEPLEAYEDNVVTDGHHRYVAAHELGLTHVPVKRMRGSWFNQAK